MNVGQVLWMQIKIHLDIFSLYIGSFVVFGVSAIAHVIVLAAIAITVGTFETAKRKPQFFGGYNGRGRGGEHE